MKKTDKISPYIWFLFLVGIHFNLFAQQTKPDSLTTLFHKAEDNSVRAELAIALSRAIHDAQHDEEKEYHYANLAVELADIAHDTLLHATALDNLGLLYRYHQHYGQAIPLHVRAYELIRSKEVDPYYLMRFANNAGVAARYDQLYDQAVKFYLKSLMIAEEHGDLKNIAIASNGLGNTLNQIAGREEESIIYFQKALAAEEARKNTLGMAINYLSISDYYNKKMDFDTARIFLDKLLQINTESNDEYGLGMTYEFYGHSYKKEGIDYKKANFFYENALKYFQDLGDLNKQADILYSLAEVAVIQKKLKTAEDHYKGSLEIAQKQEYKQLIMQNALGLSAIYEQIQDLAKALNYRKLYQSYKDSINLTEQETKIASLKLDYDFQKKEAEIALLKSSQDLQQAELETNREKLRRQRAFMYLSVGGLLMVFCLLLLFLWNLNIKNKSKLLIKEQEKKRLQVEYEKNLLQAEILASRMQVNPHFLFNCLNSIKYLIQKEKFSTAINYLTIFSRFIRVILETSKKKQVPLSDEIEVIKKYVTLEKNRFDQNFTFEVNLSGLQEDELSGIYLPPLLLQPFVENAIWHGLLPSNEVMKKLEILIKKVQCDILISIDDNGAGRRPLNKQNPVHLHKSMGTKITRDRIDLFNKNSECQIHMEIIDKINTQNHPIGTTVNIRLENAGLLLLENTVTNQTLNTPAP